MINRRRDMAFICSMLLLGLILRLVYLWQYSFSPLFYHVVGPDVSEYLSWARQILAGKLIWDKVNIHAPAYPWYLAALYWVCGGNLFGVRFLQLALGLLAMVPLFFTLRRLSPKSGLLCFAPHGYLLLAAIYPPLWFYEGETVSEALLIPLVTLSLWAIYAADRAGMAPGAWWWRALAGILCGLAVVTHPLAIFFAALEGGLLLALSFRRRRYRLKPLLLQAVIFAAGIMLSVVPVSAYNTYLHGSPVLVQKNSGYNFYLGNNPESTGGCYIWPGPKWDMVHNAAAEEAKKQGISPDAWFYRQSFQFMREQPLAWLTLELKKALYAWNWRELAAGPDLPALKYFTPLQQCGRYSFGVVAVLALTGIAFGLRCREAWWRNRHLLLLLLATWGGLTLTVVSGRYRVMFIAPLLYFAAIGALWLVRRPWHPTSILFLLAGVLIVFIPTPLVYDKDEQAQAYTIAGEAYLAAGDRGNAEKFLLLAQRQLANWSRSYNILGKMYEKEDPARAEQYFRKAVAVEPQNPYGHMNIGNLLSQRGQPGAAEPYFNRALEIAPDDPQVLYNVGYFRLRQKRVAEAEKLFRQCVAEKSDSREAINVLGVITLQSGRYAEAVGWFEKAVLLEPDNTGLQINLAAAYWAAGRVKDAEKRLALILKRQPDNAAALQLLRQLRQQP